jgi:hypothetical protein
LDVEDERLEASKVAEASALDIKAGGRVVDERGGGEAARTREAMWSSSRRLSSLK